CELEPATGAPRSPQRAAADLYLVDVAETQTQCQHEWLASLKRDDQPRQLAVRFDSERLLRDAGDRCRWMVQREAHDHFCCCCFGFARRSPVGVGSVGVTE